MSDNFTALWSAYKASIVTQREPTSVYTMDGSMDPDTLRFDTGEVDTDDKGRPMVTIHGSIERGRVMGYARKEDLLNIAEHCLLRAAQIDGHE